MKIYNKYKILIATLLTINCWTASADWFEDGDELMISTSVYTKHFSPSKEHNNNQRMLNIELDKKSGWVFGGAVFKNSFNQDSQYLYFGHKWNIPKTNELFYVKLTGGLLHGYKGKYKKKIPLNKYGVAPVILPSIGFKYKYFNAEAILFGTSGTTLTLGVNIPL